ncbi:MAG: aminodeoxychorismate synthase component I [Novosphingobium sp.]
MPAPFVLLDDARSEGASDARLYREPAEVVVARRPEEVAPALARIEALAGEGADLAGYFAYEAGLALEPRLQPLAARRWGASGPLVWFARFAHVETIAAEAMPAWLAAHASGDARIGPLVPQLSCGGYARAFAALSEAIVAGEVYQANLAFPLAGPWRGDPLALYAAIRPSAAAGYGGVVCDGTQWLLSFSPELFVSVQGNMIMARPMKGTRPRGGVLADDARLAAELSESIKDRAENLMIVDLLRNDLARVAAPGSVRVERPFAVESYPTVHQMTTTVRATLAGEPGLGGLLRALFPCGSITGAPKIRAMELIDALEPAARGAYCGAIGRVGRGAGGAIEAAFNVAIRTVSLVPEGEGGGRATMGVGSAVVADSTATGEWRECLVKGEFVARSAAASFDLVETMRFTPGKGVAMLDLHLNRLEASAAELGFAFDRATAREAIAALCRDHPVPAKVRLMVARKGAQAIELASLPAAWGAPATVAAMALPVSPGDRRLRHKTTDRGFYDAARSAAVTAGADEAIFVRDDGLVTEGSITSLFVNRDGKLLTPPVALGLLPGVLRRSLIDAAQAVEAELTLDDLAHGFLLGNALRGLVEARLLGVGASSPSRLEGKA